MGRHRKKPLEFIKNTVRSLGHGFKLLWTNIWDHLKFGLQGWLFGELAEKKINPPSSWTDPKAVFNFVLDVLGISVDHMFELLAKKFDPTKVAKLRLWFGRVAGAIDVDQQGDRHVEVAGGKRARAGRSGEGASACRS